MTGIRRITFVVLGWFMSLAILQAQPTWRKAYGALADDDCRVVRSVSDDLFITAGSTGSFGAGSADIYLLAVNGDGVRQWSRTIGGAAIEQARDMRVDADGGLWIVGSTNAGNAGYEGLLIRTDAAGEPLWQRTYGGTDWDFFESVQLMEDGGVLVAGQTFSTPGGGEAWLLRMDSSGDTLWTRTMGGAGEQVAHSATSTLDGGFAMCGSTTTDDRELDAWLVKLDAGRTIEWALPFGGDSIDVAKDIVQTLDGGYSTIGSTRSFSPFIESYHLKVDPTGTQEWFWHWGQVDDQEGSELHQFPTGEYMSVGYTKTSGGGGKDMFLQKSASNGDFIFGRTFGGAEDDEGFSLALTSTGYLCGGVTRSYGAGGTDVFLVRTDVEGLTESQTVGTEFDPLAIEERSSVMRGAIHPMPNAGLFQLDDRYDPAHGRVMDVNGRTIAWLPSMVRGERIEVFLSTGYYLLEWTERSGALHRDPLIITRP